VKIAYIVDTFPNYSEKFILRELRALEKSGLDIQLLALKKGEYGKNGGNDTKEINVKYARLFSPAMLLAWLHYGCLHPIRYMTCLWHIFAAGTVSVFLFLQQLKALFRALDLLGQTGSFGHYHAHFAYVTADVARMLTRLTGSQWSVSAHAWDIFTQAEEILAFRLQGVEKIFCCTACGAMVLDDKYFQAVDKMVLMNHGVDSSRFEPVFSPGKTILGVGRLEPKKGFADLVEACSLLKAKGVDVSCRIVGGGPEKTALMAQIKRLDLGEEVELKGVLNQAELYEEYASCAFVVLPCCETDDGDRDGLPNVLLEAQAMGKAIISTSVGGIPELIRDGENGFLVPSGNTAQLAAAMGKLLAEKGLAEKFGRNGRKIITAHFELDKIIKPMREYFQEK